MSIKGRSAVGTGTNLRLPNHPVRQIHDGFCLYGLAGPGGLGAGAMAATLEIARLKASIWPLLAGKHGLRDAGLAAHLRDWCAQLVPPDGRDDLLERMTFPRLSKPAPTLPSFCQKFVLGIDPHFFGGRQSQAARRAGGR